MRKNVFGRQFKRDSNERKALFKGLMSSLVLQERIKTTEEKAKAIRPSVEKLVTLTRNHGQNSQMFLHKYLTPPAIEKMIGDVAPRFSKRNGGYTRIIRLGKRFSDNAQTALIEWVEKTQIADIAAPTSQKKEKKVEKTPQPKVIEAKAKTPRKKAASKLTTKKEVTKKVK